MGTSEHGQGSGAAGAGQPVPAPEGNARIGARPESGFDAQLVSPLGSHPPFSVGTSIQPTQQALLNAVHRGLTDPLGDAPVAGSFGPQGAMQFDFAHAQVLADPMAWRALRVARELPHAVAQAEPGPNATRREMDLTVWDLGAAAGTMKDVPLRNAPTNWWHTPLMPVMMHTLPRYSAVRSHLELARLLVEGGPATPAQLAQRCHVSASELRVFIQAGLFVVLLHWMSATTVQP